MTVKQTDRAQIHAFAQAGDVLFDEIGTRLRTLVQECADVPYRGANAVSFKGDCVTLALAFADACSKNMNMIDQAISEATTYIAMALGGEAITLDPPVVAIDAPSFDTNVDVESADGEPLIALRASIQVQFDEITARFEDNLGNFQTLGQDGWIGPEYDTALADVSMLTAKAGEDVNLAKTNLVNRITNQLTSLGMDG